LKKHFCEGVEKHQVYLCFVTQLLTASFYETPPIKLSILFLEEQTTC